MNWIKRIFGGGAKKKSSSRPKRKRNNRHKSAKSVTAKKQSVRTRKSKSESTRRSRPKTVKKTAAKQQSGQTFSNAFTLAKRELPGVREADAAFRPTDRPRSDDGQSEPPQRPIPGQSRSPQTRPRPIEPESGEEPAPLSLGEVSSPRIRRPN